MVALLITGVLVLAFFLGTLVGRGAGHWISDLFANNENRVNTGGVVMLLVVVMAGLSLAVYQFWFQKEMPNKEIIQSALYAGAGAYLGSKAEGMITKIKEKAAGLEKLSVPDLGGAGGGEPPKEG
jgi:uncharacterized membrane protein